MTMVTSSTRTDNLVEALKKAKVAGGKRNLVAAGAMRRLPPILKEVERCKFPFPKISPQLDGGACLIWSSPDRDIELEVSPKGRIEFHTAERSRDVDGEVGSVCTSDGIIMNSRGIDSLLAWFLTNTTNPTKPS